MREIQDELRKDAGSKKIIVVKDLMSYYKDQKIQKIQKNEKELSGYFDKKLRGKQSIFINIDPQPHVVCSDV